MAYELWFDETSIATAYPVEVGEGEPLTVEMEVRIADPSQTNVLFGGTDNKDALFYMKVRSEGWIDVMWEGWGGSGQHPELLSADEFKLVQVHLTTGNAQVVIGGVSIDIFILVAGPAAVGTDNLSIGSDVDAWQFDWVKGCIKNFKVTNGIGGPVIASWAIDDNVPNSGTIAANQSVYDGVLGLGNGYWYLPTEPVVEIAVQIDAVSGVSGTAEVPVVEITVQSDAVSSVSTTTSVITTGAVQIDAISGVTVTATGMVIATVVIDATSTVSTTAEVTKYLEAQVDAVTNASVTVDIFRHVAVQVDAVSSVLVTADIVEQLEVQADALSTVSITAEVVLPVIEEATVEVDATSVVSIMADLVLGPSEMAVRSFAVSTVSIVAEVILGPVPITVDVDATSTVSAALLQLHNVSQTIDAVASVSVTGFSTAGVSVMIDAVSEVTIIAGSIATNLRPNQYGVLSACSRHTDWVSSSKVTTFESSTRGTKQFQPTER